VERAYQERRVVVGRVIERVKGGSPSTSASAPSSPAARWTCAPSATSTRSRAGAPHARHQGQQKRGNIVLSRQGVLEEENAERKTQTLETLEEGKVLAGTVKNITEYGAFVDLGGSTACSTSPTFLGRINHRARSSTSATSCGVVLKFDRETERVSLA